VLVCVKAGATPDAGAALAAVLKPGAVVLSLQNGLANAETLRHLLPLQVVLPGMVAFNVVPTAPGSFHQATAGGLAAQDHPVLRLWQAAFAAAGLPLGLHADLAPVQWGKLLLNLGNAINALSGLPLLAMLQQRDYRRCMALAQREALQLMRARGIAPARLTPLPAAWVPALLELPNALFVRLARRMLEVDPQARSSMADDLDKGRPSEVDWLNGEVVRLAEMGQGRAPINARLARLVHGAQAGGPRVWAAPALLAELRGAAEFGS
jgi:2-dehydropantoate 2-reductase